MPYSRLSEIDLAKAMSVPPGPLLEAELRNYNAGFGPWSYEPTRASTPDLLGAASPLLGPVSPVPWLTLARRIQSACHRGPNQIAANVQVSQVLFNGVRALGWRAVQQPMGRLSIGFGESVRFWSDVVLADEHGPFIPFFDHRGGGGADQSGRTPHRILYAAYRCARAKPRPCRCSAGDYPIPGQR
jgi:hypothetical protein